MVQISKVCLQQSAISKEQGDMVLQEIINVSYCSLRKKQRDMAYVW
jgi:hypothetical protein